jgi:hypothetical protein
VGLSYTNLLNLVTVTNNGTIQANEFADLRRSENQGFDTFINRGQVIAFGTEITANNFESTGDIISSNNYTAPLFATTFFLDVDCFGSPQTTTFVGFTGGGIGINAQQAKIDAGRFITLGDIRFSGNVFKINHHEANAGGRMTFDVSGILTDDGEIQDNVWTVRNGFEMTPVRPLGDLLGTEIRSFASRLASIDHIWSAEDRGPTIAGFTDNSAIGRLRLEGDDLSIYRFIPGRENSAIYLDVLDIEGVQAASIRDFTNTVKLQMNVYYGNVESTNGIFSAERLNRILGTNAPFNFYWVTNWAGPNSGVDVPLTENGPVRRFNRALRESPNIDSDGDGLPNLYDPFPFPPEAFGITGITFAADAQSVVFGLNTMASGTYIIETTTNLAAPDWQPLSQALQKNQSGGIMSITDQVRAGSPQRYYRARKAP